MRDVKVERLLALSGWGWKLQATTGYGTGRVHLHNKHRLC